MRKSPANTVGRFLCIQANFASALAMFSNALAKLPNMSARLPRTQGKVANTRGKKFCILKSLTNVLGKAICVQKIVFCAQIA